MAALLGLAFVLFCLSSSSRLVEASSSNDGSVLQALLESQYSEWMELVERAQMLHPLEQLMASGNKLTIFAPQNHQLHPKVKSFLLKPSNAHLLRKTVEFHVLSKRITLAQWRNSIVNTLATDPVTLSSDVDLQGNVKLHVGEAEVVAPDSISRADGVVHGVDQMLLPMSVQQQYVAFTTKNLPTPLPTGAPGLDARRAILLEHESLIASIVNENVASILSISPASAPSPSLAPAPAPSLGPSGAPLFAFGEEEVTTFVTALTGFGGYNEFAQLLTDLTSLGSQISRLINMGYKLTILAPDNKAWTHVTAEQLNSQTAIESILLYHIITEYQTEESLYSTLKRLGETTFSTLKFPSKLNAREVDGQVVFGEGKTEAGVWDHDIFADGRVSVQGINKVLIPPAEADSSETSTTPVKTIKETRKLQEIIKPPTLAWRVRSGGLERLEKGSMLIPLIAASVVLSVTNFLI